MKPAFVDINWKPSDDNVDDGSNVLQADDMNAGANRYIQYSIPTGLSHVAFFLQSVAIEVATVECQLDDVARCPHLMPLCNTSASALCDKASHRHFTFFIFFIGSSFEKPQTRNAQAVFCSVSLMTSR